MVLIAAASVSAVVCRADIPPPRSFERAERVVGKGVAVKVIYVDDTVERGSETHPDGSLWGTASYCQAVLDIVAGSMTNGVLTVRGSPIVTVTGPFFDLLSPLYIHPKKDGTRLSVIVDLTQNYTAFNWVPDTQTSHGPLTVYVIPVRCPGLHG